MNMRKTTRWLLIALLVLSAATFTRQRKAVAQSSTAAPKAASMASPTSALWQDFVNSKRSGSVPVLPDFSYAGYHRMESPIPDVAGPVFNVLHYGAKPDDDKSDEEAIKSAIAAAESKGCGVVFFPRGRFMVDSKEQIRITHSNIVLRGSGAGAGGTEIFQKNYLDPRNPDQMYSTPHKFDFGPTSVSESTLTTITADAPRETFWITVDDSSRLRIGQRIQLEATTKKAPYISPYPLSPGWSPTLRFSEKHQVAEIKGNRVRLGEPLHLDVKAADNYAVRTYTVIEEVGAEDIAFVGNWQGKFVHHRSALDDSGWSLVAFNNVANGWIRRCRFQDANEMLEINRSTMISAVQLQMGGNPAHFCTSGGGNYGVLYGLSRLETSQFHGPSLQTAATGTVIWRYEMPKDVNWDTHAAGPPYANLVDACRGRFDTKHNGGGVSGRPNHLRLFVVWNYENIGGAVSSLTLWTGNLGDYVLPIVVGVHGDPVTFRDLKQLEVLESNGAKVWPESLFEAQLALRLGKLPEWLQKMITEVPAGGSMGHQAGERLHLPRG